MKKLFFTFLAIAAFCSCNQQQQETEADTPSATATDAAETTYGAAFAADKVISPADLQAKVAQQDFVQAVVEAEIVESCQAKGCWMDVRLNDSTTMKVTFKDYAFFVPTEDLSGKTVVFKGTAKKETVSVDQRRHYAEDAGKSEAEIKAITTPSEEIRFVAEGVTFTE